MKPNPISLILIVLVFTLSACATAAAPTMAPMATAGAAYAPSVKTSTDSAGLPGSETSNSVQTADSNRLVIRNADLTIIVADPSAGMTAIMEMANQMGGYVVSSKSFKTTAENGVEVPQANVEVRVPAEKLDEALATIHKLTTDPTQDIRSENVTGQDITADYVDLQSRLTNLQNTETQLQRIQDSATKIDDVLNVFNQLTSIRQQIEQLKGQIKYYEESAALSSIKVSLLSKAGIAPISIGGWEPVGVVRDAFQSLIDVGKFLVEALIWILLFFVPIGLVLYFPGRWIWKFIKRRLPAKRVNQSLTDIPPYPPQSPPPQYPNMQ